MDSLNVDGARPAVGRVASLPAAWTTDADRLVLLALACDSYDGETAAPGAENLAAWTGLHRSTVYAALHRLSVPTDERPALVAIDDTKKGRRRTRYRLTLPSQQPSDEADRSTIPEPSGQPDGSATPTVGQPSGNRRPSPTVRPSQPSANRRPRADTPSPSSNPPPRARDRVAAEVRSELLAEGLEEAEADDLIRYAEADPDTHSPRRLLAAPYRTEVLAAVRGYATARRHDDAARQLAEFAASSPEAASVVEALASSYADRPGLHLRHARNDLADAGHSEGTRDDVA